MADTESVGSLGEEAARFLRALAASSSRSEPGAPADSVGSAASDHVCSTTWCPVCQVVGFVREHPEVVEQLTDSAVQMARSVRDLLEHAEPPTGDTDSA